MFKMQSLVHLNISSQEGHWKRCKIGKPKWSESWSTLHRGKNISGLLLFFVCFSEMQLMWDVTETQNMHGEVMRSIFPLPHHHVEWWQTPHDELICLPCFPTCWEWHGWGLGQLLFPPVLQSCSFETTAERRREGIHAKMNGRGTSTPSSWGAPPPSFIQGWVGVCLCTLSRDGKINVVWKVGATLDSPNIQTWFHSMKLINGSSMMDRRRLFLTAHN